MKRKKIIPPFVDGFALNVCDFGRKESISLGSEVKKENGVQAVKF